jgi:hypothetical protein
MKTIDPVAGLVGLAVVSVIYLGLMRLLASD